MKQFVATVLMALSFVGAASAADIPFLIDELSLNSVYVATNVPGADSNTLGVLKTELRKNDNIILVMLPRDNDEAEAIALEINKGLGGKKIVGLTAGDKAVGYSTLLPSGVAAQLMKRAATVSTTMEETLGTFAQNVHDWQRQHPQAAAAQPTKKGGGTSMARVLVFLLLIVIVFVFIASVLLSKKKPKTGDEVQLKKSPDPVRDQLSRLLKSRDRIKDTYLHDTLTQICRDTEAFFQRRKIDESDTSVFEAHLSSLNNVMERYLDIQDNPRYFEDPESLLNSGEEAAASFAIFVLEAIRRDGRRDLTDFRVDTDILSAQRYS